MSAAGSVDDWRPGAGLEAMRQRAALNARIREFFAARQVLEVETPLLARSGATDPHLASFQVAGAEPRLLQTSPEFAMKRLLAAGSGPIYQLCKCFRRGESGRRHNPEFTMLEWYRPGFDLNQLMQEVQQLLAALVDVQGIRSISYRRLWLDTLQLNPHRVTVDELRATVSGRLDIDAASAPAGLSEWLDLGMSQLIEPQLSGQGGVFVTDYPACQAALSEIVDNRYGEAVARRFELYLDGVEIANGYLELRDSNELERRFAQDNLSREALGLPAVPADEYLLAAQRAGLPACSGVALGVDRLLMHQLGETGIDRVLAFATHRV